MWPAALFIEAKGVTNGLFLILHLDGGQRLDDEETLHGAIRQSSEDRLLPTWEEVLRP